MYKVRLFIVLLFLIPITSSAEEDSTFGALKKYLFFNYSHIPHLERVAEIQRIEVRIDEALRISPYSAKYNMLKGFQMYAKIYADERLDEKSKVKLKLGSQKYFKIALEKNASENVLSLVELEVLRTYSGPELIPKVVDEIIGLQESYDNKELVQLIRSKIMALIRLGEFEEARLEINELRENYPQRFKQTSVAYYEEEIARAVDELQAAQDATVTAIEKPKEELVEKNVTVEVADETKEFPSDIQVENVAPQRTINSYWLFLFVAIIVLGLFIYKRKKNK